MLNYLKSFPFLSAASVQALLALLLAFGLHLTPGQTGSIEAAAAALLALLTVPTVKQVPVPLMLGLITAIGAVLVAFKVPHLNSGEVAAIVAALSALLGGIGHLGVDNKFLAAKRAAARVNRPQMTP